MATGPTETVTVVQLRLNKVSVLTQWLSKTVTISWEEAPGFMVGNVMHTGREYEATLSEVNAFWVTFLIHAGPAKLSEPIEKLMLSWDNEKDRPKILA